MRPSILGFSIVFFAGALLMGCAGETAPNLMNLRSDSSGPDEFAILPVKQLALPKDLAVLPPPTPNGTNLVDPDPRGDAIAALGGKQRLDGPIDNSIVTYASRGGVTPDIRAILAAEDLEFRKRNSGRLLERWLKVTTYFKAYRNQSLDQTAELARWRAKGVATPSAPPPPVK